MKEIVVKTELSLELFKERDLFFTEKRKWRIRFTYVFMASISFFIGAAMFLHSPDGGAYIGIVLFLFGLLFLTPVVFPNIFARVLNTPIGPNEITLTFCDDRLNVDASGGRSGEIFCRLRGRYRDVVIWIYGDTNWAYRRMEVTRFGDHFEIVYDFSYSVVFRGSHITEGDPMALKRFLTEKLGRRYREYDMP